MSAFSRRQFLITAGLGGAAVLLPRWVKRQGGGEVSDTAVPSAPVNDQAWGFDLAFPAYFSVLPAVIDPTPMPTATPTQTAVPTATSTPTQTAVPTATPTAPGLPTATATGTPTIQPQSHNLYLPLVAVEGTIVPSKENQR